MNLAIVGSVLAYAAFPAAAAVAGGGLALVRAPGPRMRSAVQHFAAGVIFCVLATELLPDLVHRHMPWVTVVGFSIGVAVMLAMKWASERNGGEGGQPSAMLVAMGVDVALDGLLIGLTAAAGKKQGLLLTIGLVLEVFFLGVSCATSLAADGAPRARVMRSVGTLGALLLAGATAGALAVAALPAVFLDAVLAFGVAALLYLVTEELLVEAHEVKETPIQTAMFFFGFIVLFTIDMYI